MNIESLNFKEAFDKLLKDFTPVRGWNINWVNSTLSVGTIELPNGKTGQVQMIITTDDNEFIDDEDELDTDDENEEVDNG